MTTMTKTFDVDRSIDILNKAAEYKMYEADSEGKAVLPESDGDKIIEAEKLVALAEQAKEVADQAGSEKVAHYKAVMDILFIAQVVGGSTTVGMNAAEPATEPEPEPTPPGSPYIIGHVWADESGNNWIINKGPVNDEIEVQLEGTTEITTIPVAHLKTKIKEAESSTPSSESSSSGLQPSSGGSSSTPPSIPATTPTSAQPSAPPTGGDSPQQPSPSGSSSSTSSTDPLIPVDDDEGDSEYGELLERSERVFVQAHLPLPPPIVDPPSMPDDLTAISDLQQRKLHSQFNACAARAHFMLGIERQRKIDCKRLMGLSLRPAMRTAREKLGKDATVTELKQEAEDNPNVHKWLTRVERHGDREDAYKTLYDIYTENVSVLSRDWTMRDNDEAGS